MFEGDNYFPTTNQEQDYEDLDDEGDEKEHYISLLGKKTKSNSRPRIRPKAKMKQVHQLKYFNASNKYSDTEDDDDDHEDDDDDDDEDDEDYDNDFKHNNKINNNDKLTKQKKHYWRNKNKIINNKNLYNKIEKPKESSHKKAQKTFIDNSEENKVSTTKQFDVSNFGNENDANNRSVKNNDLNTDDNLMIPMISENNNENSNCRSNSINKLQKKFNLKVSIPLESNINSIQLNMPYLEMPSQNRDNDVNINLIPFDGNFNQSSIHINSNQVMSVNNNTNTKDITVNNTISNSQHQKKLFNSDNNTDKHLIQSNKNIVHQIADANQGIAQLKQIIPGNKGNVLLTDNKSYFALLKNTSNHPLLQSPFNYESPSYRKANLTHTVNNPLSYHYYHPSPHQFNEYDSKYYNNNTNYFQYPSFNESNDMINHNKRFRDDIYNNVSPIRQGLYPNPHFFSDYGSIGNNFRQNISPLTPHNFNLIDDNMINNTGSNNNNNSLNTPNLNLNQSQNLKAGNRENVIEENSKNKEKLQTNIMSCNGNCNCNKHIN